MVKTSECRVLPSASPTRSLCYRRKAPVLTDKEPPKADESKQLKSQHDVNQSQQLKRELHGDSKSEKEDRFPSKSRHLSKQQSALLKQPLWKAKAVQPTPARAPTLTRQQSSCNEDKEVALVEEQHQVQKLRTSGVDALAATKRKTVAHEPSSSESFVAGSSSQETQSGSEDDVVFLRYSDLRPSVKGRMSQEQQNGVAESERDESVCPVMTSEEVEKKQVGLEKAAVARRKQRRKYRLKPKQTRAAAKGLERLQYQQKQEKERLHATAEDTESTPDGESATADKFHPATILMSEMDAGVCRAVVSQLQEVVPVIVVGDVACPVVAASDEQLVGAATRDSEVAIVDFRQHINAVLDRSKETQVQSRDSFVVENSGFDAVSSYDFFKHRFCDIEKTAGIVYH